MTILMKRVGDRILPGSRPAIDMPLAELCDFLILSANVAIPRPPQNTSAQTGTGPAAECKDEDLSPLAAGLAAENAYLTGAVRQETRRVLRMALKSPIVRLCLAFAVIAVGSVSVVGVLSLRATSEEVPAANAFPNSTSLGPMGASVSTPDPSPATRATVAVASATDQNHAPEFPGEPRSLERPPDSEGKRLTLSSVKSPDLTAATPTAAERALEIAAAAPKPVPAAPPSAAAPSVPDDLSAPKPEATPAVARLEMPKDTSPNVSGSPNRRVATPTAVTPPSEPHASTAETALLLARGDSLFGVGDVASARLFYERAADAGNGGAALRLGETFDPNFLKRAKLRAVQGDAAAAVFWYRRARELGIAEAEILLKSPADPGSAADDAVRDAVHLEGRGGGRRRWGGRPDAAVGGRALHVRDSRRHQPVQQHFRDRRRVEMDGRAQGRTHAPRARW
jgi:hypothetical protein